MLLLKSWDSYGVVVKLKTHARSIAKRIRWWVESVYLVRKRKQMTLMLKQVKGQRFSLLWEDGEEGALAVAEETQCRASGLAGTSPVCCRLEGKMGFGA